MIVTRTPFRITLGGGGTDLPAYYSQHGGFIFSVGIDKYMFINVNRPTVDDLIRVKYSKSETVARVDDVQHEVAREALRMLGIARGIEIISLADVPAGTGLGSSSCYTVGLLNALHTLKREYISLHNLAEEGCRLEMEILGKPIGKQDQYLAAFGGLTVLDIAPSGRVKVRRARVSEHVAEELNRNLLLFYTHTSRSADSILAEQGTAVRQEKKDVVESMHAMKEIGYRVLEAVEQGNIDDVGMLFDQHWQQKKKLSSQMTNARFDAIYTAAREHGALGGKISGAGGGGFFTFYVPHAQQRRVREAMAGFGLRELRYRFDVEGTRVMINA